MKMSAEYILTLIVNNQNKKMDIDSTSNYEKLCYFDVRRVLSMVEELYINSLRWWRDEIQTPHWSCDRQQRRNREGRRKTSTQAKEPHMQQKPTPAKTLVFDDHLSFADIRSDSRSLFSVLCEIDCQDGICCR